MAAARRIRTTCLSSKQASEHGIFLGYRWAGLSVSETADLLGPCLGFTIYISGVRGKYADWLEMVEMQQ